MPPKKKTGRPRSENAISYDGDGNEMVGFRYDASADTYYYTWKDKKEGKWKRKNLSRDEGKANFKYYQVKAAVEGDTFSTVKNLITRKV